MALGTLALNITGCPKEEEEGEKEGDDDSGSLSAFAASVAEALAALAPRSVALPLSLRALNATRLRPGRCPLSGRLAQAPLQVAAGTQVTFFFLVKFRRRCYEKKSSLSNLDL